MPAQGVLGIAQVAFSIPQLLNSSNAEIGTLKKPQYVIRRRDSPYRG